MRRLTIAVLILTASFCRTFSVSAADPKPWYELDQKPVTLKNALAAEFVLLGTGNPGYKMSANPSLCAVFKSVGLGCDYNTRSTLTMFLTVNGKDLFPAADGTNPYFTTRLPGDFPDDAYIDTGLQNLMLRNAVELNYRLFRNGDLTADDVRNRWR